MEKLEELEEQILEHAEVLEEEQVQQIEQHAEVLEILSKEKERQKGTTPTAD